MKRTLNILGVLLILIGIIWFLQGVSILPGSMMSGQIQWAVNGALATTLGLGLMARVRRE